MDHIVKFNGYQSLIDHIVQDEESDVTFFFPQKADQEINAHKKLLLAACPAFQAKFNGNWNEPLTVTIEDADADNFLIFISFLYGNEIQIDNSNVCGLLDLAKKYEIGQLVPWLLNYMTEHLCVANAVDYLSAAIVYDLPELLDMCKKLISECTNDVLQTHGFLECCGGVLSVIQTLEQISCTEAEMFDGCMEWAKRQCHNAGQELTGENLREQLGDNFQLIRFKEMKEQEFVDRCKLYQGELFSSSQLCSVVVYFNENSGMIPNPRQIRLPQLSISNVQPGFLLTYRFPGIVPYPIMNEAESVIRFTVNQPMLFYEMQLPRVFVGNGLSGMMEQREYVLTVQMRCGDLSYGPFEANMGNRDCIVKFASKPMITANEEHELKVTIRQINKAQMDTAFIFGHHIFSQTLNGVDLVVKKDEYLGQNGTGWIAGMSFEPANDADFWALNYEYAVGE